MTADCIVLDEATSMLDPQGAKDMLELVQRLNKEKKITVIMVTHRIAEALMADKSTTYWIIAGSWQRVHLETYLQMLTGLRAMDWRYRLI